MYDRGSAFWLKRFWLSTLSLSEELRNIVETPFVFYVILFCTPYRHRSFHLDFLCCQFLCEIDILKRGASKLIPATTV